MTTSLLHRWFGPGKVSPSVEEARAELDHLAAERPSFKPVLDWLREMLPELTPSGGVECRLTMEPARARAKLAGGMPLLRGEPLTIDPREFRRRWRRACEALESHQPDGTAAALVEAVRRGRLTPGELIQAVLAGRPEDVRRQAEQHGLDPALTTTVLRFTLFPVFTSLAESLAPLRHGAAWDQGYCPTCGSWPLSGEFRGLDQSRFLRCGLCASGWEVPRLYCPFCGNRDHERLGSLQREGEETEVRAAVCEACRGYVKVPTVLSALPPLQLLVADALTLHLDLAVAERGYTSPP